MNESDSTAASRLVILGGPEAGRTVEVTQRSSVVIGRAAGSDVLLADPGVSRRHAVVERGTADVTITDAGSRSGTHVNGVPVAGTMPLADGDLVTVGQTMLRFESVHGGSAAPVGPDGTRIFMCYRRDDARGFARALYDDLSERFGPAAVFRDVDALAPGEDFASRIGDAIASCDVAVVLIGRTWANATDEQGRRRLDDPDDLLVQEIAVALDSPRTVIPVLIDGAAMPDDADLPPAIRGLARRNAIEISDSRWSTDVERLVAAIGTPPPASGPRPVAPVTPTNGTGATGGRGGSRSILPAVVGVVVVAVLVVVGIVLVAGGSGDGGTVDHPRLSIEPPGGAAGSTATATATGFEAGEIVQVHFQGGLVGQADADGDGVALVTFEVPRQFASFAPERFPVTASGSSSARSADALFDLTG